MSILCSKKAQSAMEYLLTYGWAVLIITIVLAALSYLGVFNPLTFAPRSAPGACSVHRPQGPQSLEDISLQGVCNGEIPETVTGFNPNIGSYIQIPSSALLNSNSMFSISAWVYLNQPITDQGMILGTYLGNYQGFHLFRTSSTAGFQIGEGSSNAQNAQIYVSSSYFPLNKWVFIAGTYNGFTMTYYINGKPMASLNGVTAWSWASQPFEIGREAWCACKRMDGMVSNMQFYNASLDGTAIATLYSEGIGGSPVNLQNLLGWWPLNGNTYDYSGNGETGNPSNVVFTGSWLNGYSVP